MHQKSLSQIALTGGLIVILAAGVTTWSYMKETSSLPSSNNQVAQPIRDSNPPVPSPQTTAAFPAAQDETVNWKTYGNEKHGFQFKYPSDWIVDDKEDKTASSIWIVLLSSPDDLYSFSVRTKISPLEPESFIYEGNTQIVQINHESYAAYLFPMGYECYGAGQHDCSFFSIPINKNGDWYILQGEGAINNSIRGLYEQILSTFEFTREL